MNDEYSFGRCDKCGIFGALKNGLCSVCRIDIPEFFNKLFGGKNEN